MVEVELQLSLLPEVAEALPMPVEAVEVEVEMSLVLLLVVVVLVSVAMTVVSRPAVAKHPSKVEVRADRAEGVLALAAQRADRDGLATRSQPQFVPHMDALLEAECGYAYQFQL